MDEEIRRISAHGGVAAHTATREIMPQPWPMVSPDQTNEIERRPAGAVRKCPTFGSPNTALERS